MATILELPVEELPLPGPGEDPASGWTISRWLGGLGLGLVRIAQAESFSWPGPWIARISSSSGPPQAPEVGSDSRFVVMYGVPSGVVWDPAQPNEPAAGPPAEGVLIAATDIALAMPPRPPAPAGSGELVSICLAAAAGERVQLPEATRAIAGRGLDGDRHTFGTGTFPSGPPGSALTLIAAEVCESFDPPLQPNEHRRNLVTRGIDLNRLVGREFTIGDVVCRGMRLCEPCTVVQGYAGRPVLRALVHRGGLRADILTDGVLRVGDVVRVSADAGRSSGDHRLRATDGG